MNATQHQPNTLADLNGHASGDVVPFLQTYNHARSFSRSLVKIWDSVKHYKDRGIVNSEDDRYFIAYRQAECELREAHEIIEKLQSQLAETTKQLSDTQVLSKSA